MTMPTEDSTDRLTPELRHAIIAAYAGECQYCGAAGSNHVDHIIPRAAGGGDELENLTLACGPCNMRKTSRPLTPLFGAIAHSLAASMAPKIRALMEARKISRAPRRQTPPRADWERDWGRRYPYPVLLKPSLWSADNPAFLSRCSARMARDFIDTPMETRHAAGITVARYAHVCICGMTLDVVRVKDGVVTGRVLTKKAEAAAEAERRMLPLTTPPSPWGEDSTDPAG